MKQFWAGFSVGESVQWWRLREQYSRILINHFVHLTWNKKTCINPRLIPTEQPHWLILLPVIAIGQRLRQPWGSFPVAEDSFVLFLLWRMSELANAPDESEDLREKKMSQTRETLVICSEPEHNRDVACAWYAVNYSKHCSEVGTSFKRSFWWALFFIFSPSSDKFIFNSVAELS